MMKPKYPIYIISKGRFENGLRLTQELLERLGVPYRMVVEDSEFDVVRREYVLDKIRINYIHVTIPSIDLHFRLQR